jgi:hypothetical protein
VGGGEFGGAAGRLAAEEVGEGLEHGVFAVLFADFGAVRQARGGREAAAKGRRVLVGFVW